MPLSVAEVNLNHLLHNYRLLKSYLQPGTLQMSVIKADGYGHGAVPVAKALEPHTDWFAVVNIDEAIELREAGIQHDILVFGPPTEEAAPAYISHNLTAVISDIDHFKLLRKGTAYHVEFDTGMGRLGIQHHMVNEVKEKLQSYRELIPGGIMTHFSSADIPGDRKTDEQIAMFGQIRNCFAGIDNLLFHAANTAGVLNYPEGHFDMVRHGLGLYGYGSQLNAECNLKPVMHWKSGIVQCKRIGKGTSVSYGGIWSAPADGYLGIIPVGYADGYKRSLSGKTRVLINGTPYPVVGRVTMDFLMVFLGDHPLRPGTEVILMGAEENNADVWAELLDTIAYEILCGLHNRVLRTYIPVSAG